MAPALRFSYVLPDPMSYPNWGEFVGDLAALRSAGYDAVELQITDPAAIDEVRISQALSQVGYQVCAIQTGGTYTTRGNCLSTADAAVRQRTIRLLHSFVDLAARWNSLLVFGSLQGRLKDEPNREVGSARIIEALREVGTDATKQRVTLAFEPVCHAEVGFHNTIAAVAAQVRQLNLPGVRMMVDTFHMNIEEHDRLAPLAGIRDLLAHVHLSETNRDVFGTGHWPMGAFLAELKRLDYQGVISVGVYNSRLPRRDCLQRCRQHLRELK